MSKRWDLPWQDDPLPLVEHFHERQLTCTEIRLSSKPQARHWHVSQPGETGTLEVTWDPKALEFWISMRSNRSGTWIEDNAEEIVERVTAI